MKNQIKLIALIICTINAKTTLAQLLPNGTLNSIFLQPSYPGGGNDQLSVGIGNFAAPGVGLYPNAFFHTNSNLIPALPANGSIATFGEMFWSDCPNDAATYWRMLRGNTHYGWLWNFSRDEDANDFSMGSPSGSLLFHTLEGTYSGVTSTMIPHFRISNSDLSAMPTPIPTYLTTASMERVEVTPAVLGSASALGFGGVLQNPRLLVVGGNDDGTTEPVAEFRSIAENTSSVGIKIRGSRHAAIKSNCAFIDFANYIDEDNTEYPLARISSDQRNYLNYSGYLRIFTSDDLTGTSGLIQKLMIDFNGYTGIGYNLFDADNQPNRRLESYEAGTDDGVFPQLRLTRDYNDDVALGTFTDFETNYYNGHANLYIHPSSDVSSPGSPVEGMVGINIQHANNTLEIFSTALSPRPAGLRFSNINSSSFDISPNGKVLTVDPNGDVCITLGGTGSVSLANNGLSLDPGSSGTIIQLGHELGIGSGASLLHHSEIPFDNFNLVFTDPVSNVHGTSNSIGIGTTAPAAKLDVVRNYSSFGQVANPTGVHILNNDFNSSSSGSSYGIKVDVTNTNTSIGITSFSYGGYFKTVDALTNYGIYSEATDASSVNYGGFFVADNANINYAVYAVTTSNCSGTTFTGTGSCASAAGYFQDAVISTNGYYVVSDSMFKTNVNEILGASSILDQLTPKSYYFDTVQYAKMNFRKGLRYGLIVEEVMNVLPQFPRGFIEPETKDSVGNIIQPEIYYGALPYEEFIPLLIAGFKEQKHLIDSLITALQGQPKQNNLNQSDPKDNLNNQLKVSLSNSKVVYLSQNIPNPFDDNTTISFSIPVEVKTAQIIFTENTGVVLKSMEITQRGESSLTVFGHNLSKGIYSYTLVVDSQVIDSKKMVKQ